MNVYYYFYCCAYWFSFKDLKRSSVVSKEYALIFISILDLHFSIIVFCLINLFLGINILSAVGVIIIACIIVVINYLIFIKGDRYLKILKSFSHLENDSFSIKRKKVLFVSYAIFGGIAVVMAMLNNKYLV